MPCENRFPETPVCAIQFVPRCISCIASSAFPHSSNKRPGYFSSHAKPCLLSNRSGHAVEWVRIFHQLIILYLLWWWPGWWLVGVVPIHSLRRLHLGILLPTEISSVLITVIARRTALLAVCWRRVVRLIVSTPVYFLLRLLCCDIWVIGGLSVPKWRPSHPTCTVVWLLAEALSTSCAQKAKVACQRMIAW